MAGSIYLLRGDGEFIPMNEHGYQTEDRLQALLADHPDLLPGDQIDTVTPRRWLLVSREVPLPSEEDAAGRWSVDHLFLDQDAVPTLVEVKRSEDTRIRREVMGQVLEYAAHATVYWPVELIQERFREHCGKQRVPRDPEEVLAAFLDQDRKPEEFWESVKTNLQARKVRLIFVADKIPAELQRTVEFLSDQFKLAQILAIEVKQYQGEGVTTLVPRVLNRIPAIPQQKSWDEPSFMDALRTRCGPTEVRVAKNLLEWATRQKLRIWWGKGRKDGSFYPMIDRDAASYWTFAAWTNGRINIPFQTMATRAPFDDDAKRVDLLNRLNSISGVDLPADSITKYPGFPMSALANDAALRQFEGGHGMGHPSYSPAIDRASRPDLIPLPWFEHG
jgi:hypothetical protein